MPHRVLKPNGQELVTNWYKADFTYDPDAELPWLLLPKFRGGGKVYINGIEEVRLMESGPDRQMHWRHPQLFSIHASALHAGKNQIAIRMPTREAHNSFGGIMIGSEQEMRKAQAQLQLWQHTASDFFSGAAMFIGLFICAIWLFHPKEPTLGLFGLALIFWSLFAAVFRITEIPIVAFHFWLLALYFTLGGFFATLTLSIIGVQGGNKPLAAKIILGCWLGSSLIILFSENVTIRAMEVSWILSILPMLAYALVLSIKANLRQPSLVNFAISFSMLVLVLCMLHDYAARTGMFNMAEAYSLHLSIPVWLLTAGIVAMERYLNSLKHADGLKHELALNLIEHEAAQVANYERRRQSDNRHAMSTERQRIMREMHDGLGSNLLSALVIAQRGGATQDEIVALLKECVDEMRLTIESFSPTDPDLLSVLGNFRFRMESRFTATGIRLVWRNHDMPEELNIGSEACLQVLRILQEALTNVLKHAGAQTVEIDVRYKLEGIQIRIADNGVGINPAERSTGLGLGNMQTRAKKIGAVMTIAKILDGTEILLNIPFSSEQAGREPYTVKAI